MPRIVHYSSALFQARLLTSGLKLAFQKSSVGGAPVPLVRLADGSAHQQRARASAAVLRGSCG